MTKPIASEPRKRLIRQAVDLLHVSRHHAVRQTNSLMVYTYFHLGRLIVEFQQAGNAKAMYGAETIKLLSKELCRQFGDGYSERNLELIRSFFLTYKSREKKVPIPQTVSAELGRAQKSQTVSAKSFKSSNAVFSQESFLKIFPLSWSHHVSLCRLKSKQEQSFYEIESVQGNWSVRELQRQIDSGLFERLILSKNKTKVKELARKGQIVTKPEVYLPSKEDIKRIIE